MRVPVPRRSVVIGTVAALAVVLAAGLVVVVRGGGREPVRLAAPPYAADPVPKVSPVGDIPENCGVRAATVRRYAPDDDGGQDDGECRWYSLNTGKKDCDFCPAGSGDRERVLDVVISRGDERTVNGASPGGNALRALDPAAALTDAHPPRTVTGLGGEAMYRYSPSLMASSTEPEGASLVFRVGAAVVSVAYDGRDFADDGPTSQVPEKEAKPAVLAAAADVARALHAPAKPAFTEPRPAGPPPIRRMPRPCDLVPDTLVDRLAEGAVRSRGTLPGAPGGNTYRMAADACDWDAKPTCCLGKDTDHRPERHLSVTVLSAPELRPGLALRMAGRAYLERHYDARDGAGGTGFRALRGLGDQAYAVYRDQRVASTGRSGGEVVFRHRNLLVIVTYTASDDHPLAHEAALTGAYNAAAHARSALPG